ncbi:MAG: MFS transporter, partial [candidate division WOR-3 bacterium]
MDGKRISIIEGIFAQFHITLTGGMFLTSFALFLNANPFQMGVLVSIPSLLAGAGFFSAYIANLTGKRKSPNLITALAGRSLFLFFIIGLIFNIRISINFFFVIIFFFNLLLNFSGNLWLSWMSDLVPKEERGRYFGIRNTIISGVAMVVNYAGGRILDIYAPNQAFVIIFSVAVFFAVLAGITLSFQPEPGFEKKPIHFKDVFLTPLKDSNFVALIKFVSFWYLFAGIAGPFWVVHMIKNLKMAYSTIAIYGIIAGIASLVFQLFWGKLIDRVKSKPILAINFVGITFLPLI